MTRSEDHSLPPMKWNAWGDPASAKPLSEGIRTLLVQALGVQAGTGSEPEADQVRLRPSALSDSDRAALAAVVGDAHCISDDYGRLLRAGGKSTLDLLRRNDSGVQDAPDAVLLPADEGEVAEVLRLCAQRSIAVVPFGGGTSVVGGLDPLRGDFKAVVSLDLRRLDALHGIDEVSGEAELGAGVTGPDAEKLLAAHGFSLGHFPQSFQFATIGGFAATRSSGQNSAGYGRFDDMVRGLRVLTPAGVLDLGRAPASAAGPDLRQLILGSEGVFGVITRVRVRIHPIPETTLYEAWSFPDFATGAAALRAVVQTGTGPTVIRLSDEAETGVSLATTETIGEQSVTGGCLAITAFEGAPAHAASRHAETRAVLEALRRYVTRRGTRAGVGARPFRGAVPPRLAAGRRGPVRDVGDGDDLVEPFCTEGCRYGGPDHVARTDTPALVLCHISHVYPTGASLYFTVVAAQRGNPIEQWRKAKTAASDAMVRHGGTITHHHAVGADHRPWMRDEIGDLGVEVLRAVKAVLDPAGILNPGKLIP